MVERVFLSVTPACLRISVKYVSHLEASVEPLTTSSLSKNGFVLYSIWVSISVETLYPSSFSRVDINGILIWTSVLPASKKMVSMFFIVEFNNYSQKKTSKEGQFVDKTSGAV